MFTLLKLELEKLFRSRNFYLSFVVLIGFVVLMLWGFYTYAARKSGGEAVEQFRYTYESKQYFNGMEQLNVLLGLLHGRYRGEVAQAGQSDRYEAVLVKDRGATFTAIEGGQRYALAAYFKPHADEPEVVLLSAHADAFNAARRRRYTEDLMDWAQLHLSHSTEVFIAGDFNFELKAANETNLYTDNVKHDSESYSHILRSFLDLGREARLRSSHPRPGTN